MPEALKAVSKGATRATVRLAPSPTMSNLEPLIEHLEIVGNSLLDEGVKRHDSVRLLEAVLEHLPCCVAVKDAQFRYTLVNSAYRNACLRPDKQDWIGATDAEMLSPEIVAQIRPRDEYVLHTGERMDYAMTIPAPAGGEWSSSTAP